MSDQHPSIRLDRLTRRFGTQLALDDVSATIEPGSFTAVLGPSGSGKSTLLMTIAGFQDPDEGSVWFAEENITDLPAEKRGIGVVFQGYAVFPHLTIYDNIAYPLRARRRPRREIDTEVRRIAALMEIEPLLNRRSSEISGGQRQRVAIARALVFNPKLLLLDEPLSALDRNLRDRMKAELRRIHQQFGVTIIMVTHDQDEACELADRILLMKDGRVIADGGPRALYVTPPDRDVAAFFGRANVLRIEDRDADTITAGGARFPRSSFTGEGGHLLIRPEDLQPDDGTAGARLNVQLDSVVFRSGRFGLSGRLPTGEPIQAELGDGEGHAMAAGDTLALSVRRGHLID